MIPNEIFLIGGGNSISNGISLGLKEKIKNKFVIALNFAFYDFEHTFMTFVDSDFYLGKLEEKQPLNKEHANAIKNLPLVIGHDNNEVLKYKYPNTILLKNSYTYTRDILKKGCFRSILCGCWAISLAMWLIDFKGTLFLIGYDFTRRTPEQIKNKEKAKTHYYDKKHRGQGFTYYYETHKPESFFQPFLQEKEIKIYNVSPNSNIPCFEKIDYPTFFNKLTDVKHDQNQLRTEIKGKLHAL